MHGVGWAGSCLGYANTAAEICSQIPPCLREQYFYTTRLLRLHGLQTPTTSMYSSVHTRLLQKYKGIKITTLPASFSTSQAVMDAVQALICLRTIASLVTAFRMTWTLKRQICRLRQVAQELPSPASIFNPPSRTSGSCSGPVGIGGCPMRRAGKDRIGQM